MREFKGISYKWIDCVFDLFISEDRLGWLRKFDSRSDDERFAKNTVAIALNAVIGNRNCAQIDHNTLEQLLIESGKDSVAILAVHGLYVDGAWYYCETKEMYESAWEYGSSVQVLTGDGVQTVSQLIKLSDGYIFPAGLGKVIEVHPVSRWVEQQSGGKYGVLVLNCCNELSSSPNIKDTAIFYVEGNIGFVEFYDTKLLKPLESSPLLE